MYRMQPQPSKPLDPPPESLLTDVIQAGDYHHYEPIGVLVADDEHFMRVMVQVGLEREGFAVWTAASGREAINLYRKYRAEITLVLLDINMPGLDGPATLDALRKLNPEVLVCFMSGNAGEYDPQELLLRGAAHFIAKPFHMDQLARVLRLVARSVSANLHPSGHRCQK
jgi:CheY-like chemotaxis protein